MEILKYASIIIALFFILISAALITIAVVSIAEGEKRAARRSAFASVLIAAAGFLAVLTDYPGKVPLAMVIMLFAALLLWLFLKRPLTASPEKRSTPVRNVDEHDTIFARMKFVPGTAVWDEYYRSHPYEAEQDHVARQMPGLLSPGGIFFDGYNFTAADTAFDIIKYLHEAIGHPRAGTEAGFTAGALTEYITTWAGYLGVNSIGITHLRDYHLYTRRGRGADIGKPVTNDHRFAIAFTVMMDSRNMQSAPFSPVIFESSHKYLSCATTALLLATFLKKSGYDARAHIDGDYEVICPLVAADAGLGEIGRMGLLMTPENGPRVRIAVVTTNAPLVTSEERYYPAFTEFCRVCSKCADCCPSQAIPAGEMQNRDGVLRWKTDPDACYHYWCTTGTDCGRCISVCPFSHPSNIVHNTVRHLIMRSKVVARLAVKADDLLYGRKPVPRKRQTGSMTSGLL